MYIYNPKYITMKQRRTRLTPNNYITLKVGEFIPMLIEADPEKPGYIAFRFPNRVQHFHISETVDLAQALYDKGMEAAHNNYEGTITMKANGEELFTIPAAQILDILQLIKRELPKALDYEITEK